MPKRMDPEECMEPKQGAKAEAKEERMEKGSGMKPDLQRGRIVGPAAPTKGFGSNPAKR